LEKIHPFTHCFKDFQQRAHGAVVDLPLTGMQMNYLGLPWVTRFEAKVPLMHHVSIIWPNHWSTVDSEG